MRILLTILALASFCGAQELLRPTADLDAGNNLLLGCHAINQSSITMPLSRDAAGLTTKSSQSVTATKTISSFRSRVFYPWATTTATYSALTLNVNWSVQEVSPSGEQGAACVAYSIDSGATYTSMGCSIGAQAVQTSSATLSPTLPLASLRVGVCVVAPQGNFTNGNTDILSISDIWTVGTTGNAGGGAGSNSGQANRDTVIVN